MIMNTAFGQKKLAIIGIHSPSHLLSLPGSLYFFDFFGGMVMVPHNKTAVISSNSLPSSLNLARFGPWLLTAMLDPRCSNSPQGIGRSPPHLK